MTSGHDKLFESNGRQIEYGNRDHKKEIAERIGSGVRPTIEGSTRIPWSRDLGPAPSLYLDPRHERRQVGRVVVDKQEAIAIGCLAPR